MGAQRPRHFPCLMGLSCTPYPPTKSVHFLLHAAKFTVLNTFSSTFLFSQNFCAIFWIVSLTCLSAACFLKVFYFIFLERGKGREKMKERNINVRENYRSVSQACALTRNWTSDLLLCGTTPNQLSHTSQGSFGQFSLPVSNILFKSSVAFLFLGIILFSSRLLLVFFIVSSFLPKILIVAFISWNINTVFVVVSFFFFSSLCLKISVHHVSGSFLLLLPRVLGCI